MHLAIVTCTTPGERQRNSLLPRRMNSPIQLVTLTEVNKNRADGCISQPVLLQWECPMKNRVTSGFFHAYFQQRGLIARRVAISRRRFDGLGLICWRRRSCPDVREQRAVLFSEWDRLPNKRRLGRPWKRPASHRAATRRLSGRGRTHLGSDGLCALWWRASLGLDLVRRSRRGFRASRVFAWPAYRSRWP